MTPIQMYQKVMRELHDELEGKSSLDRTCRELTPRLKPVSLDPHVRAQAQIECEEVYGS